MKKLKLTDKHVDLIGESVLAKIHKNQDAMDMLTCNDAREAISKEIDELNKILVILTQV